MPFAKLGAEVWRNYATDGVPESGLHRISKEDMRAWMLEVEGNSPEILEDGTAAAPALAFNSDPDTGLYRVAANTLGISAGGVGRVQVSTAALSPVANDGVSLGTSALGFSDLHLATGGLLNWANGDFTVTHSTGELAFSGIVTLPNTGLHLLDTNASHDLIVKPGSNLTADRIFTLTTGDAARTLDISAADVTISTFGASLVDDAAATNARTTLGLVIGTDVEAHDADLTTIAGLSPSNDDIIQRKAGAWANRTIAQLLTDLAVPGTTFQPLDSDLTSIAALSTQTFGRSLLTAASAAAAQALLVVREVLTANRTYYVRTDGSDSNTGLVNNAGGAFLTIQKAIDIVGGLDVSIYNVTISVQAGTYTGANTIKNFVGAGRCTIEGVGATTIVSTTSVTAFSLNGIDSLWTVKDLKVQTTTSGNGFALIAASILTITGVEFGAFPGSAIHIYSGQNCFVFITANYTISGGGGYHYYAELGGKIYVNGGLTTTVSGTPSFTIFALATNLGAIRSTTQTFSGSATGTRCSVSVNAVIVDTGTAVNGTYFPGNVAGAAATGGQFT